MTVPLVSIVVASHDYGRFLGEAIQSALDQTHPAIEVIVVDDGSHDDSVEVARRYPVRLVQQANAGVARARNRGAATATGPLIVFLDADDVLAPTFVERCWEALRTEGPGVGYAYTQMQAFGDKTDLFASRPFDGPALFEGNFVPVTTLLRRRAFEAVGGFDPSWPAHEDHEFWARLFVRGFSGKFVEAPLLRYRFHGESRNRLTDAQREALHARLVLEHPRYGWRWMLRHPLTTARVLSGGGGAP